MIRWPLILAAVLLAGSAHAAQFEIGAGLAHATTQGNGTWYQDGFQHTLKLNQPFVEIGVTGAITPHMDWHVDAVSLGRYASNSEDTPRDPNYSGVGPTYCNGPCDTLANYIGSGSVYGVQALIARHTGGSWQLGIEGGPLLYHETWQMDVPNWYTPQGVPYSIATDGARWAVGAVVGITLSHGPWSLALRYYDDGADVAHTGGSGTWPPLWSGQTVAMLGYAW